MKRRQKRIREKMEKEREKMKAGAIEDGKVSEPGTAVSSISLSLSFTLYCTLFLFPSFFCPPFLSLL
jgi:hypothetical protein